MNQVSLTPLIPAAFGIPLFILGMLAQKDHLRKQATYASALIGMIGFLSTVQALPKLRTFFTGAELLRPYAVVSQSIMAFLCGILVILCIKSVVTAKKNLPNL